MVDSGSDARDEAGAKPSAEEPATIDPREQMREALARKNAKSHEGQAHLEGSPKAGGEHAKAGGSRQFRRKSGG